jgi:plastocyanin
MRLRKRYLVLAAVLVSVIVAIPTVASSVPLSVEAVNESGSSCPGSGYYSTTECHHWSNAQQTIPAGETVKFSNPNTVLPYHGLKFTGPTPSSCPGIAAVEGPNGALGHWEIECTFSKPGIYTFICTVHPSEMKGTITVTGTPTDATTSASGETQTEAMLNGSINPEGNTVEYHFEYEGPGVTGKQSTPTATLSAADFTSHSVSAQVMGLQPSMTYHFLLVATYGAGKTVAGATTQMFTTRAVTAPTATTLAAEGFKETEATLKGTVNLGGEATEYFFEYGTDTNYGQKTAQATLQTSGGSNQGVSAALKGLTPGTEYHFRLVAKNAVGGPINGVDRTFKTESPLAPKEPPSPTTTTTTPPPPPTTTTATTTTPIGEPPPGSPIVGGPSLAASQHGSSVRGSLDISPAGAGGHLEVDLFAKSASLAKARHSSSVRVGRLVHSSVSAGKVSFSVALTVAGKRALARKHRLSLTVKIVITPTRGAPVSIARSVVLRS